MLYFTWCRACCIAIPVDTLYFGHFVVYSSHCYLAIGSYYHSTLFLLVSLSALAVRGDVVEISDFALSHAHLQVDFPSFCISSDHKNHAWNRYSKCRPIGRNLLIFTCDLTLDTATDGVNLIIGLTLLPFLERQWVGTRCVLSPVSPLQILFTLLKTGKT